MPRINGVLVHFEEMFSPFSLPFPGDELDHQLLTPSMESKDFHTEASYPSPRPKSARRFSFGQWRGGRSCHLHIGRSVGSASRSATSYRPTPNLRLGAACARPAHPEQRRQIERAAEKAPRKSCDGRIRLLERQRLPQNESEPLQRRRPKPRSLQWESGGRGWWTCGWSRLATSI
jgi:hypothetical protein